MKSHRRIATSTGHIQSSTGRPAARVEPRGENTAREVLSGPLSETVRDGHDQWNSLRRLTKPTPRRENLVSRRDELTVLSFLPVGPDGNSPRKTLFVNMLAEARSASC